MTRTDESPGGSERRVRISSAEARLPSEKTAFMISRSRRVSGGGVVLGIVKCDTCLIIGATGVACQDLNFGLGSVAATKNTGRDAGIAGLEAHSTKCRH